ncbi:bile acid-CoA:amino acid N-acyltransferase [Pelodiscus sinensis]|uniref:Bile acid-CoA:amino acid N-acyltransferase n=1 Tax=Pelodiscus sinensis TaxID=13735 RepID=K7FMS7_PELSI|nr:bile acid-CoA:amino acid N-acyltransferase [Pelodiscus sinensis]XP_025038743.1 bile acid-CoA:amino acid N-acyltransferase [Pelodiscus sinensis]XP_025038745.1 bile acid-CoA:amino acid N-acyltransferase [Pelodiscus sinensis]|eukprot:XP_006111136.1 bile acid-CoA:amino acid N-acyltransferase [Pelodiscus sinensis]
MVRLTVTPKVSLADEPLKIQVSGLPPSQLVTLQASLTDEKGVFFYSRALYWSDKAGEVDLERAAATGGDYAGVQPMGLFHVLKPEKPFYRLMKRDVMQSPFQIRLDLFDSNHLFSSPHDQPVASQTVDRWYVAPGVQRVQIRGNRVRGALFLPPGDGPFPGVIDLFGGIGGLIEFRASLLASRGFVALALAYFAYEDLPSCLDEVDLEYFEEAANILLGHPKVGGAGVGVVAICKGAEIALAMATFLPQITATVCINGTNAMHGTALRYRHLYVSPIPYRFECVQITALGLLSLYSVIGDTQAEANQGSLIPVEKALGQILFVVGESDQNYNSKAFAEEAMERMGQHGRKNCTLLSYPGAGHLIEPPGSPFCSCSWNPFFSLPLMWGGEAHAHAAAQEHSWREIQKFLWHHLCHTGSSKL